MLHSEFSLSQASGESRGLLIGTSGRGGRGIYAAQFSDGMLSEPVLVFEATKASFLTRASGRQDIAFAVNQPESSSSEALALRVHANGKLATSGKAFSLTAGGVHISATKDGRSVVLANYGGASVASFLVKSDGRLSLASHIAFPSDAHGPDTERQKQSFAHSAVFSPDESFVLVNDLGLDCIHIFRVDETSAELTPNDPPRWKARPGSGPRHLAFHPNACQAYSINELDSTIDLLAWDAARGILTLQSTVRTLPEGVAAAGKRACEMVISEDLRYLYASNRVCEDFVVFRIEAQTGALSLVQHLPNPGKESQHIAIDPSGDFLLSANQHSDEISVFPIDRTSGHLRERSHSVPLAGPSCLLFL